MHNNKFIDFIGSIIVLPFMIFFFICKKTHDIFIKIPFIKRRREKKKAEEKRRFEERLKQVKINQYKRDIKMWNECKMISFFYDGELPFDMYNYKVFVYIESHYNEKINTFIHQHWEEINNEFELRGCRLLYVPKWKFDTSMLHLANLGKERTEKVKEALKNMTTVQYSHILMKVLGFEDEIGDNYSGIFHFARSSKYDDDYTLDKDTEKCMFTYCSMFNLDDEGLKGFFHFYLRGLAMQKEAPHDGFNKTTHKSYSVQTQKINHPDTYECSISPDTKTDTYECSISPDAKRDTYECSINIDAKREECNNPIRMKKIAENIKERD